MNRDRACSNDTDFRVAPRPGRIESERVRKRKEKKATTTTTTMTTTHIAKRYMI